MPLYGHFARVVFRRQEPMFSFLIYVSSFSLPHSVPSSCYSSLCLPPFLACLFPPTPASSKPYPMPMSKASVGSEGFWAVEDVTSAAASSDWQLIYIYTQSHLQLISSVSQEGALPFACIKQSSEWRVPSLGCGFCRWKFGSGFVLCPCQLPLTYLMEKTVEMKCHVSCQKQFHVFSGITPCFSPDICFISRYAGSPTSKLTSVCQASHGTGSPVSKTHGSSFVTSVVKVMFSLGAYFPFKIQLPIK